MLCKWESVNSRASLEACGSADYATAPFLVRAVSPKTKPLPMEQLQVIQSFLHAVPQGRKMVEEVSKGAEQGAGAGAVNSPHWWGLFLL